MLLGSIWESAILLCMDYNRINFEPLTFFRMLLLLIEELVSTMQGEEEKKTTKHSFSFPSQVCDWWEYKYQLLSTKREGHVYCQKIF